MNVEAMVARIERTNSILLTGPSEFMRPMKDIEVDLEFWNMNMLISKIEFHFREYKNAKALLERQEILFYKGKDGK